MLGKKHSQYLYPALAVVAALLIFIGDRLEWVGLQALGGALLGAGLFAVGIESIRTRFFDIGVDPGRLTSSNRFVFRGPGAISWGLLCVALGLVFVVVAAIALFDLESAAERLIRARPGLLITPLAFIFLTSAAGWLFGEELMNSSPLMFLATLPHRLGAVVAVLFSLALLAVGVFELAAPVAFDQLVDSLRPPPPPEIPAR